MAAQIIVKGRIGNVRYLEIEFGATKQRIDRYMAYVVTPATDDDLRFLIERLHEDVEGGLGIWFDVVEPLDLHPAYQGIAQYLWDRDEDATNETCTAFALKQVEKIGKGKPDSIKVELAMIAQDIRDRGGDAYAQHKARLQTLAA